jgi:predicted PurR-regulated permease PerM
MDRLSTVARVSIIGIGVFTLFVAMDMGQEVLAPVLLAFVVGIVMSPVSDGITRVGLPSGAAALSSLVIILALLSALFLFLEPIFYRAIEAAPRVIVELNQIILFIKSKLNSFQDIGDGVQRALNETGGVPVPTAPQPEEAASDATDALPSVEQALFMAPAILSQAMIFIGTLFFFILTRDEVYDFIARRLVADELRMETAHRLRAAERQVGRYFLTISIINAGYAVVVSLAMMMIGLPSPILWGVAAGLLNYILYLGPVTMLVAFALAGLVAFEGAYSILPAAIYLSINIIEAQFVTPSLVGKAMNVNPLLVFLTLVFLLWLWGPLGGIIAIPLLLWIIVLSADIRAVRGIARRVESEDPPEPRAA